MYLIVCTNGFEKFENWRQMACYAGVAPFEHTSGTSVGGKTKVSPLADLKLKSLLNMCAIVAVQHDTELKAYYERKLADGKPKMRGTLSGASHTNFNALTWKLYDLNPLRFQHRQSRVFEFEFLNLAASRQGKSIDE
jgi:hypothetical protein